MRWGPGVVRHVDRTADVGFWRGNQLLRLAWRPAMTSLVPDLALCPIGQRHIEQFRVVLLDSEKAVGEVNSSLDLPKSQGDSPLEATDLWQRVYSKYCTDIESALCHKSEFYKSYFGDTVHILEEALPSQLEVSTISDSRVLQV